MFPPWLMASLCIVCPIANIVMLVRLRKRHGRGPGFARWLAIAALCCCVLFAIVWVYMLATFRAFAGGNPALERAMPWLIYAFTALTVAAIPMALAGIGSDKP